MFYSYLLNIHNEPNGIIKLLQQTYPPFKQNHAVFVAFSQQFCVIQCFCFIRYLNLVFLFRLVFNSHFVLSSFNIFIIQKTKGKCVKALMQRVDVASDDISSQIIPLCVFTFYLRHFWMWLYDKMKSIEYV